MNIYRVMQHEQLKHSVIECWFIQKLTLKGWRYKTGYFKSFEDAFALIKKKKVPSELYVNFDRVKNGFIQTKLTH